jgi:hypothetical protein
MSVLKSFVIWDYVNVNRSKSFIICDRVNVNHSDKFITNNSCLDQGNLPISLSHSSPLVLGLGRFGCMIVSLLLFMQNFIPNE